METITILIAALFLVLLTWVISQLYFRRQQTQTDSERIPLSVFQNLDAQYQELQQAHQAQGVELAKVQQQLSDAKRRLEEQHAAFADTQKQLRLEMQEFSQQVLEQKSQQFLQLNQKQISAILDPLKERIGHFEQKVDRSGKEQLAWSTALKEQVKQLAQANQQMAEDAKRLTSALKGDKKLQGNWGEMQLEQILETAGLQRDVHYQKEAVKQADDGRHYRPDFIIHLPDKKHLVVDAKVSLMAYEQYHHATSPQEQQQYLQQHLAALQQHMQGLSRKNYQHLHGITSPDYVMLFVPIEPALHLALQADSGLFEKALQLNIVLVSTTTLLATLRTIAYIWRQENQQQNALEIAQESGALYDKFVGFLDDLKTVDERIQAAQIAITDARKKLVESPKTGTTIVGRIEKIKALGAAAKKQLENG